MLRLSDFDYHLPRELIAQYPLKERDNCRLLVLDRKKATIEHRVFSDITDYLKMGDLVVFNDTKVLPCRLKGRRVTGGKVEIFLLNRRDGLTFNAMIKPGRVKIGEKIIFNGDSSFGTISAMGQITFNFKDEKKVYELGVMPLPPYIKRDAQESDNIYYQTVYAKEEGAVASPTAGLHFTESLMKRMKSYGVDLAYVTLHVGIGTFKPVETDDITEHKMDPEYFKIPLDTVRAIEKARRGKSRIIAVGTTSLRALETHGAGVNQGSTELFIYPGYEFLISDCLLTNFHLPRTTLFMLVCAFAGKEIVKEAYQKAIDKGYRFYSYGDAMLII